MGRARHEATWTHEDATVKGSAGGNHGWWMLGLGFAVVAVLSVLAFNRFMNFQDVTFQLRHCQGDLTDDSTWADVEAAGCEPAVIEGDVLTMWHEGSQSMADATARTEWTFNDVPINTVVNAMEITTSSAARSVVLAEPDNEKIRRALTSDSSHTRWSASIGDRGPTTYWVLVTPEE